MYLLYIASKLQREKDKKQPYYGKLIELPKINNTDSSGNLSTNLSIQENNDEEKYCEVLSKRVKKNNITTKNIGEIILSQIPNVSSQSAIAIMLKFKTIKALLYSLEENRNCMNDIRVGKIGKERRLSKICISNIFKFLVETDD
jgi:ERCC4-type nuclease